MQQTRRRLLGAVSAGLASLAGCAGLVGDRERWTFRTGQDNKRPNNIMGGAAVGAGTVYQPCLDGRVYALDAATGDEQWRFEADGPIWTLPTLSDGTLFVASHSRNVAYALSPGSGVPQWTTPLADPGSVTSSPTAAGGKVFVGSDERLHALDAATGEEQWRQETDRAYLSWGAPLVVDDRVFVTGTFGSLYAFDAPSGAPRWQFETNHNINGSPVYESETIYFGTDTGSVYAVDATDGTERWTTGLPARVERMAPVLNEGLVYMGTEEGVAVLDADSGERVRQFETAGPVRSTPVLRDDVLFVGDHGVKDGDGYTARLYAVDVESGESRWTYELDAAVEASPAVTEEAVYVGDLAGVLHAVSR